MVVYAEVKELKTTEAVQTDDEAGPGVPLTTLEDLLGSYLQDIGEWSPHMRSEVLIGSVGDARLRMKAPLRVRFEVEGEHTIAEAVEVSEFGFGANRAAAIRDLQKAIVELYFTLELEQNRLGSDLQSVWTCLQEKISRQ